MEELRSRLVRLESHDFLEAGPLPIQIRSAWQPVVSGIVVITGERYHHFIERHPSMAGAEASVILTLLDPEEIHRNKKDGRIAILHRRLGERTHARVALWLSDNPELHNSVHSARKAWDREIRQGRTGGRLVWRG